MFLRFTTRKKNGKEHRYYSLVENRRVASGRVIQRHALYLGEINDTQQEAWRKTIEIFEEGQTRPRTVALFPEDRIGPVADADIVRIRLSQLSLHRPRQWGACWLAGELWERLGLDRFWAERLPPSRKGTRWDWVLRILVTYRLLDLGSEWRLYRHWFEHSAMADLLGADQELAEIHKLYECHERLLEHKRDLFTHLTQRWKDLFNARFEVLLHDLTSTYFESDPPFAPGDKRRYGYSRDKCSFTRINRYRWLSNERLKFDWVVRHADDGYLMVNLDGQITFANERARSWLGLPAEEEPGEMACFLAAARRLYRLEPEDAWQAWEEPTASQPKTPRFFLRPETLSEHGLWLRVELLELTAGLQGSRLVRLRDVTGQMRDRRDLWTLRRALCHKLKTPLIGLVGCLDMLTTSEEVAQRSEIAELAGLASTSAQRLDESVTDLLQYLENPALGRDDAVFALSDLPALLSQIGAEMKLGSPRFDMSQELECQSIALATRGFEVVLRELLENAQKFHPGHSPTVAVTVTNVGNSRIKLTLCDDGVNLSPQELSQVWIPGYQAEKHFTGEVPGMGMGLPMVASIVWQTGGSCRLRSRNDGQPGICVELFLPLAGHVNS